MLSPSYRNKETASPAYEAGTATPRFKLDARARLPSLMGAAWHRTDAFLFTPAANTSV